MPSNSTIPITDSLRAGYYDLTYTADIAQHAFCRASNVNFQCYGGLSGHDLHFPADLYEPTMFFPDDEGNSEPANLQFAEESRIPGAVTNRGYSSRSVWHRLRYQ